MERKIYYKKSATCNCINLRRASLSITEVYDEMLAPSGLKISQYLLISNIKRLGPISVSNIALEIRLDRTTIVRNLKPLEARGLIIDIATKGARNRQLKLTDKGSEILEVALPLWVEAQNYIKQYLGEEDINTLTRLLAKIEALVP
ncbi:MarR family winged helix-turn-helix transcriptional regulator [Clostridium estertheticum]|uniref:MarR family transcriptional regulator n=1 Tax=Clostridium estertheticum subsp. estertheticum TaxID=1552 RepID=A0A1J0GDN3_9CLOT|nr:MarR family winged helix-turn-helix transcriptional regulator [Clostridium estertheticum]APC39415.1 MarR family transcriptional regulator [Clostridium estertheticum subsp. estertheticum]MBU3072089.1 MarR family winged helix-turn-helix transcriptional regulator [Clostridium estertheticum]MBU3162181.1 MarR family winged helix-turn-helix transcriptional regulator [Clostridium estertheticum]MBU3170612.1 MarR family winged helix-turn-helix transcriptional regulator [Clostridium estertheticum]MBZ